MWGTYGFRRACVSVELQWPEDVLPRAMLHEGGRVWVRGSKGDQTCPHSALEAAQAPSSEEIISTFPSPVLWCGALSTWKKRRLLLIIIVGSPYEPGTHCSRALVVCSQQFWSHRSLEINFCCLLLYIPNHCSL